MIGDKSLYLVATGEAGLWAAITGWLRMVSPRGRKQYQRFSAVSAGFVALLADGEPDQTVRLEVRRATQAKRLKVRLALLVVVSLFALEWLSYLAPALTVWANAVLHRC